MFITTVRESLGALGLLSCLSHPTGLPAPVWVTRKEGLGFSSEKEKGEKKRRLLAK